MNQLAVIQALTNWLRSSLDEPGLQVKCDHVTAEKVESAIYLEEKPGGRKRESDQGSRYNHRRSKSKDGSTGSRGRSRRRTSQAVRGFLCADAG